MKKVYNKNYFDRLAIKKGFKSAAQRSMIYKVLKERKEGVIHDNKQNTI